MSDREPHKNYVESVATKDLIGEYQSIQATCALPLLRGPVPEPRAASASPGPPARGPPRLAAVPWARWIALVDKTVGGCNGRRARQLDLHEIDRLRLSSSLSALHSMLSLLRARRKLRSSFAPSPQPSPPCTVTLKCEGYGEGEGQTYDADKGVIYRLWGMLPWVVRAFRAYKTAPAPSVIVPAGQCLSLLVLEAHAAQVSLCRYTTMEVEAAVEAVLSRWGSVSLHIMAVSCEVWASLRKVGATTKDLLFEVDRKIRDFSSWSDWQREQGGPELANAVCRLLQVNCRQQLRWTRTWDVEWAATLLKIDLPLRLTEKLALITNTFTTDALATGDSNILFPPALQCLKRHCYCDCNLSSTPKTCIISPNLCVALHALLRRSKGFEVLRSYLSGGFMEVVVVVLNSHPYNVDVQIVCCQIMLVLLRAPHRQFSTIYPAVQAVLKAIYRMGAFQHFALSVLLALVNYPRFESHRAVLDTMLSLRTISDTAWEVIAHVSECHLEVNEAVKILHDLVGFLRSTSTALPKLPGYAVKVVSHTICYIGESAAALQDISWISEAFFSLYRQCNPFSHSEVCTFIECMAVLSVPHLVDMGALDILVAVLVDSKSIVTGCKAVLRLVQDNLMKDIVASKMKPVVITAIEMLGSTPTTSEVYYLWRTLAAFITSEQSTYVPSELQPVITAMLSGEFSILSHRAYEHMLLLSKSESSSFLPVMQNIPELFPRHSFSKTAADLVDMMTTSLSKDCRNSLSIPLPLVELLLEFVLSVDGYISQSTWRSLLQLIKFKSGLEEALKLGIIDMLPHLAENIKKKEKQIQQEALEMLVRTFNYLQPHNIPRETFLGYIQVLLEQFSYLQRVSFNAVWRGIACYFLGSSSGTLWEDVLLVMKKYPGLFKVQILALKTLHHSLSLEQVKAVNPSIEIIASILSKEGKLSRNARWCKWAFRVVAQLHPSYLVCNVVELVRREFVSFCFGALCPSQAKLCSSALKTLCFISSTPFGCEAINSFCNVGKIITKMKTCNPNTVEPLLYLLKKSVHDTPSAQSAQSQLDKLPILESFSMYSKAHKLYIDVYTKLLRYSTPSPPKFGAPAPPNSAGGKICQSHDPDTLCFACYHFNQFHSCITCDGPSSSRNYCRGCIAASHYRHEISPPKLLVATCCCAPVGETTALTILVPDPIYPFFSMDLPNALQAALPQACGLGPGQLEVHPPQTAVHIPDARRCLLIRVHTQRHYDIHRVAGALRSADAAVLLLCAARFPRVGRGSFLHSLLPLALDRIGRFLCPSPTLLRILLDNRVEILEGPGPSSYPCTQQSLRTQPQYTKGVKCVYEVPLSVCKHCWMQFDRCKCPVVDNYWCRGTGIIISKCTCGCRQRVLDIQSGR
ncbi:hypothetical protein Pelo_12533 [Pelomyxa schiedti]|nr:hypothetical protein Pelo_12533 [Pelomyxa schiedti]